MELSPMDKLALVTISEMNYFLLRRATGKSEINDAEEFIEGLSRFVEHLADAVKHDAVSDHIRKDIDEELNAGDYFETVDDLRENLRAEFELLTENPQTELVDFYAALWRD